MLHFSITKSIFKYSQIPCATKSNCKNNGLMSHNELAIVFRLIFLNASKLSTTFKANEWKRKKRQKTLTHTKTLARVRESEANEWQFKQTIFHPHNAHIFSFRLSPSPDDESIIDSIAHFALAQCFTNANLFTYFDEFSRIFNATQNETLTLHKIPKS